ncbi:uncharacterized protein V6R79_004955 [Siganus canaliculatus]
MLEPESVLKLREAELMLPLGTQYNLVQDFQLYDLKWLDFRWEFNQTDDCNCKYGKVNLHHIMQGSRTSALKMKTDDRECLLIFSDSRLPNLELLCAFSAFWLTCRSKHTFKDASVLSV